MEPQGPPCDSLPCCIICGVNDRSRRPSLSPLTLPDHLGSEGPGNSLQVLLLPSAHKVRRPYLFFYYTQGIHGFDKGWYLTTVQIAEMLYQDQQYILSTNFRFATVNITLIHIF
jgi:hypothetical protein